MLHVKRLTLHIWFYCIIKSLNNLCCIMMSNIKLQSLCIWFSSRVGGGSVLILNCMLQNGTIIKWSVSRQYVTEMYVTKRYTSKWESVTKQYMVQNGILLRNSTKQYIIIMVQYCNGLVER
jgi:hypothetical protein